MERDKAKNLVIIGAGGFGREVQWLVERINQYTSRTAGKGVWNFLGYVDDGIAPGTKIASSIVLGGCDWLADYPEDIYVACAVGSAKVRESIIRRVQKNPRIRFPNLIDPSVICSDSIVMGQGNIICAGTILTVDIKILDFCIINLDCTIGHDVKIDSFVTLYPNVNVSGKVMIGEKAEVGTGTKIIQEKVITTGVIVGAGSTVICNLPENCTAVGSPAKPIKYHKQI